MIEQGQTPRIEPPLDPHQIFFFNRRIVADQLPGDAAILGQHQQTGGVDVQPAGRCQASQMRRLEAQACTGRLGLRRNQGHGGLVAVFGLTGNITDRLVQQDRDLPRLACPRLGRQRDHGIGRRARAQLRDPLAIDEHQPALDVGIGFASRAEAAFRHQF